MVDQLKISDKKLIEICEEFAAGFGSPKKKCAMVSWALQGYLNWQFGIKTFLVEADVEDGKKSWSHHFLRLPDGRFLDATASQFKTLKLPKIYLGALPKGYSLVSIKYEQIFPAALFEEIERLEAKNIL